MRENVSIAEYILWWVVRFLMIYATVQIYGEYKDGTKDFILFLQILATTLVTFGVTLLRVIFPKQIFFGRVPYTVQKYAMIAVFFCSFIGHYYDKCASPGYDSFLHILTGFLLVFVCYEIVMSMQLSNKPLSGFMASVVGFGMNCFVMIIWEIFEFVFDYMYAGNLQAYIPVFPEGEYLIFTLFGKPATSDQLPVLDTMLDLILAVGSSIPAAAILWAVVAHKNKKREKLESSISLSCEEIYA